MLTVVEGNKTSLIPGSSRWMAEIRQEAKRLSRVLDESYFDVGRVMYEVKYTESHDNKPVWQVWGYNRFDDYCWKELHQHPHRIDRLIRVYERLNIDLEAMDPLLRRRFIQLGFSRVTILCRILTYENLETWLKIAEQPDCSFRKLDELVKAAVAAWVEAEKLKATQAKEVAKVAKEELDPDAGLDGEEEVEERESKELGPRQMLDKARKERGDIPAVALQERLIYRRYGFPENSWEMISNAIKKMGEVSGSENDSYNFSLICLQYLANASYGKQEGDRLKATEVFCKYLEQWMGIRLVVIEKKKPEILYGYRHLHDISKSPENDPSEGEKDAAQ